MLIASHICASIEWTSAGTSFEIRQIHSEVRLCLDSIYCQILASTKSVKQKTLTHQFSRSLEVKFDVDFQTRKRQSAFVVGGFSDRLEPRRCKSWASALTWVLAVLADMLTNSLQNTSYGTHTREPTLSAVNEQKSCLAEVLCFSRMSS